MTEQKPPDRSWESWVEEQIQNAQRDGEFDRLEGKGRPIPGIEEPYDPMWWVKKLLEREKLSVLPPALEVRAKADRMLDEVWTLPTEAHVVERVAATLPRNVDHEDLYSAGVLGLLDAHAKFDTHKGVKFETYAVWRIKGAVLDQLRALDWASRSNSRLTVWTSSTGSRVSKRYSWAPASMHPKFSKPSTRRRRRGSGPKKCSRM